MFFILKILAIYLAVSFVITLICPFIFFGNGPDNDLDGV